jgi:ABC-type phosphate/phosphonate transport system substrate-binding protein
VRATARRAAMALALVGGASAASGASMVVYLPSAPVESASRIGEAVTNLGDYLNAHVPGLALTVRPFKRNEDAAAYLQASPAEVAFVLCDSAFLLDLPSGLAVVPSHRQTRAGKETQRKLVVVTAASPAQSMADLKGKSLSLAATGGSRYLERVVFDGELAPQSWFGSLVAEPDELAAAADVAFGRADAALVSEDNPLVVSRLSSKELRVLYTSAPISLPVLAFRTGALSATQQAALETALDGLGRRPADQKILDGLRIDGFTRIKDGSGRFDRAALLALPGDERRLPEIATASPRDFGLPALPSPQGGKVPFLLGFTLPDLPMPVLENTDAGR